MQQETRRETDIHLIPKAPSTAWLESSYHLNNKTWGKIPLLKAGKLPSQYTSRIF